MTRYTLKQLNEYVSQYGQYEVTKEGTRYYFYKLSHDPSVRYQRLKATSMVKLYPAIVEYLTETVPQGQATELTCEYTPALSGDTENSVAPTLKTATTKFSQYGTVEFSKTSKGYVVSFRNQFTRIGDEADTLTKLVEQLTYHMTEEVPNGQVTELTCEYVPPTSVSTDTDERGSGRVDEKLNNSQTHQPSYTPAINMVSLSMWKTKNPIKSVGSKSAKALEKRLSKLGIKSQPVAA